MFWANTWGVIAFMTNAKPFGNFSEMYFPRSSMGQNIFSIWSTASDNSAIAFLIKSLCVKPTSFSLFNIFPEGINIHGGTLAYGEW